MLSHQHEKNQTSTTKNPDRAFRPARVLTSHTFPCRLLGGGNHVDLTLGLNELDGSVTKSEKGEIASATDVVAGAETGAALTDDDGTGADSFAAKSLDTEKLGIAVAAVAAAGLTFLMCHN